jgi:hypothetical protein
MDILIGVCIRACIGCLEWDLLCRLDRSIRAATPSPQPLAFCSVRV